MGIAGLLPSLKSIQKTKHLSEFKGQTVAVDAYVWLHKGVYACATELATGKPTHKYVDYAMHRVRLLRHFGIEPYIVFDGGPLPAKRGTESERKQRREENLARGKALVAQGKHSQARECFVKCIDVTPQMAYQFIKALRAENVQYVVAPYEADAQLAYLEHIGLVSAILTEDSDLLVFGCRNVLFKLDHVANTVCHIARSDFGSVRSTTSDTSFINLHGWNDTQFRAMAILSGCDYLPSIPGIGLKTANTLLRKWKTAEAVVRAVMLEGKKNVPGGYWKQFTLAEKCFRFQRVYDPLEEKLVHLTPVEGEWDGEVDAYVGEPIEPELAKRIALGDADPVTHEAMKDINPGFRPRGHKSLQATSTPPNRTDKGKGKALGGILSFFGPNPTIPREKPTVTKIGSKPNMTGTLSGKRRLGEVMDQDMANHRQPLSPHPQGVVESNVFSTSTSCTEPKHRRVSGGSAASSSRISEDNKENICVISDDDGEDDDEPEILSELSCKANISPTQDVDLDFDDVYNGVEQEDGYMSPLSSYSKETQDVSSPAARVFTPLKKKKRKSSQHGNTSGSRGDQVGETEEKEYGRGRREWQEDEFDVEPISSPISTVKKKKKRRSLSPHIMGSNTLYNMLPSRTPTRSFSMGNKLVADTPARQVSHCAMDGLDPIADVFGGHILKDKKNIPNSVYTGPDLQSCLGDDDRPDEEQGDSELQVNGAPTAAIHSTGGSTSNLGQGSHSGSTSPASPLLRTPEDDDALPVTVATHPTGSAGGRENIIIDVDALEAEMMEVEAEREAAEGKIETEMEDLEEEAMKMQAQREKIVAQGWRTKWALGQMNRRSSSSSLSSPQASMKQKSKKRHDDGRTKRQSLPMTSTDKLRRSETNVTPLGRHSLANAGTNRPLQQLQQQTFNWSAPPKVKLRDLSASSSAGKVTSGGTWQQQLKKRSSLVFSTEQDTPTASAKNKTSTTTGLQIPKPRFRPEVDLDLEYSDTEDDVVEISEQAWKGLNRFRYQ